MRHEVSVRKKDRDNGRGVRRGVGRSDGRHEQRGKGRGRENVSVWVGREKRRGQTGPTGRAL
jgi:hypothetical protein